MLKYRLPKGDRWLWVMLVVSLVLSLDYARIVFTTETASYRIIVFFIWIGLFLGYLARIILSYRRERMKQ